MNSQELFDEYMDKLELTQKFWMGNSEEDSPLYIHGTFIEKLASIWSEGIKPGGMVPANDPLFCIPGYVSLQKVSFSVGSGHGDITLILDGLALDPDRIEFNEYYGHDTYRGKIPIEPILAIDIRHHLDNVERVYNITKGKVPLVIDTYQLVSV